VTDTTVCSVLLVQVLIVYGRGQETWSSLCTLEQEQLVGEERRRDFFRLVFAIANAALPARADAMPHQQQLDGPLELAQSSVSSQSAPSPYKARAVPLAGGGWGAPACERAAAATVHLHWQALAVEALAPALCAACQSTAH
jgi:hypothetical protein